MPTLNTAFNPQHTYNQGARVYVVLARRQSSYEYLVSAPSRISAQASVESALLDGHHPDESIAYVNGRHDTIRIMTTPVLWTPDTHRAAYAPIPGSDQYGAPTNGELL